jgi:hypothetical protein
MLNYNIIKAYESIILSYRKLQTSVAELIDASGTKHKEIWNCLGFTKDTFYRRLRVHDWKSSELQIIIPFLARRVKTKDPELYQQIGGDAIVNTPIPNPDA